MRPGYRLTDEAQDELDDFNSEYGGGNCACHISAPCGSCTHPGNPHNQAEDETAWERDTIITRQQFELVRPLLEGSRRRTRPRINDLFDVLNAILYREAHRLPWRQLPTGSPPWRSVHEYHTQWTMPQPGGGQPLLDQVRDKLKENT